MISMMFIAGCNSISPLNSVDIGISPEELQYFSSNTDSYMGCILSLDSQKKDCRNSYISMKMFDIDKNYDNYEVLLSRGDATGTFAADVAQIGLAAVGGVIPVSQTTKILTATSAAVGLTNTAASKDLILANTMQAIQHQMRTDRKSVKQTIIARMKCEASTYPVGFILSDLQAYADAGTVTSALNNLVKNAANAQATTNAGSGTATPTTTSTTPGSATTTPSSGTATNNSPGTYQLTTANGGTLTLQYKAPSDGMCPLSSQTANRGQASPAKPGAKKA